MSHKFPLAATPPQLTTPYGTKTQATKSNFPILKGLSLYRLAISAGCFREPHWHANADELGYCLSGKARVSIFASGQMHQRDARQGVPGVEPQGQGGADDAGLEGLGEATTAKGGRYASTMQRPRDGATFAIGAAQDGKIARLGGPEQPIVRRRRRWSHGNVTRGQGLGDAGGDEVFVFGALTAAGHLAQRLGPALDMGAKARGFMHQRRGQHDVLGASLVSKCRRKHRRHRPHQTRSRPVGHAEAVVVVAALLAPQNV